MTDAERQTITDAILIAQGELMELVHDWYGSSPPTLIELYDRAKPVHTSALGIWCAVVDILRARKGLDKREPEADAINLEELFRAEQSGLAQAPSDLEA